MPKKAKHSIHEHPDHKFVVTIDFVGMDPSPVQLVDGNGNVFQAPAEIAESMRHQNHVLIYTDGCVAITLYECCYAMWYLYDGSCGGGSLWEKGDWRMNNKDIERCRSSKKCQSSTTR